MTAVALALAASCCWGTSDFIGGLQTRRIPVPVVLAVVQGTGLVLVLLIIAATGEPWPGTRAAVLSVVAGAAGIIALGCFYRGLAVGTMSIVAPIGATGVVLPVAVGVATGDALSALVAVGLVVTIGGVVLATREHHDDAQRAADARLGVLLALAAAVGFGSYFVLADSAADASVLWLLALARLFAVPVLLAIARARAMPAPRGHAVPLLLVAGTLDTGATGLYGVATTQGALSIVSVVGSLYPLTTIVLARVLLGERIRPIQRVGVAAALVGVALIAAG
jgi:drug/metabolite transporter (DMT)-like permease